MYLKTDPFKLQQNIDLIQPDAAKVPKFSWLYQTQKTPEEDPTCIGSNMIGYYLHKNPEYLKSELSRIGIFQPDWIRFNPFIDAYPQIQTDTVLLKYFGMDWKTQDFTKNVIELQAWEVKNYLQKLRELHLIDSRLPVYAANYSGVKSFNITGFFHKEYMPMVLLWTGKKNMFGNFDTMLSCEIPVEHQYCQFTLKKLQPTLRAVKFCGTITAKVHITREEELLVEDISVYMPDMLIYDMLSRLNATPSGMYDFLETLACPNGYKKHGEVKFRQGFQTVERLYLPPYPVVSVTWNYDSHFSDLNLCAKGITVSADAKGFHWFRDAQYQSHDNTWVTDGPLIGAEVSPLELSELVNRCTSTALMRTTVQTNEYLSHPLYGTQPKEE